jgi:hypothetical protein
MAVGKAVPRLRAEPLDVLGLASFAPARRLGVVAKQGVINLEEKIDRRGGMAHTKAGCAFDGDER